MIQLWVMCFYIVVPLHAFPFNGKCIRNLLFLTVITLAPCNYQCQNCKRCCICFYKSYIIDKYSVLYIFREEEKLKDHVVVWTDRNKMCGLEYIDLVPLRTWRAVVKVEVSQDDIKGHQVFQHLLSFRLLWWGLAKLGPPLEQQVQLLTSHRSITW